jgi:Arc/MetJ-type ribon-helix-helix transcriptional regulator
MIAVRVADESETPDSTVAELRLAWEEGLASGPGSGADLDGIIARARAELAKTLEELT